MKRRLIGGICSVLLGCSVIAGCSSGGSSGGNKSIEIGIIAPLTGGAAAYGTQFWQGVQLAVDEVNADGGIDVGGNKQKLQATVCDDQFVAAKSVACGKKLAEQDHDIMIFTPASLSAFPLMGFNEKDNFILMATSQTPSFTTQGNKLVVRMTNDTTQTMPKWVKDAVAYFEQQKAPYKSAALMEVNTELGASWIAQFKKAWVNEGGNVVATASYDANATDFTNQIQSVLSKNPDVIVLTTVCQPSALFINQARQAGYKGAFINSAACPGGAAITSFANKANLGQLVTESSKPNFPDQYPAVAKFQQAYKDKFKDPPTETSGPTGYEGTKLFALAVQEAKSSTDTAKIHAAFKPALLKLGAGDILGITDFDPKTGQSSIKMQVGVTQADGKLTLAKAK